MKNIIKRLSLPVLVASLALTVCIGLDGSVRALSGSEFKAGRIIDDALFYKGDTMTVSQIQNFLNAKMTSCDTDGKKSISYYYNSSTGRVNDSRDSWVSSSRAVYGKRVDDWKKKNGLESMGSLAPYICLKDHRQDTGYKAGQSGLCSAIQAKTGRTAAQIIDDVARACHISQKVIIVMLQKEQGLVTDDWPWGIQYRGAMGYGCPDDAACSSEYYGFFNQVYNAALQFQRYKADPAYWNHVPFMTNQVLYQANAPSCGSKSVYIENYATAGLYNYTPYTPNKAALDNLYGTGDGCSAYGNRNFWRYYRDWFGSTSSLFSYKFENFSGSGSTINQNNSTNLGSYTETVSHGQNIHSFYYDGTNQALRYARWNGTKWTEVVLDGPGSSLPGAVSNDVGKGITATMYNGDVQLFYYDATSGNLRHAWTRNGSWFFETLDGHTVTGNRSMGNVGRHPKVMNYNDKLQLFYYDATNGDIRHAWWTGRQWKFENLDGSSSALNKREANVGASQITAAKYGKDGIQLFYYDSSYGNLRHAWWTGREWKFENLDGDNGSVGRLDGNIGQSPALLNRAGELQLFYYDSTRGNLRHAWWTGREWKFENLDGDTRSILKNDENLGGGNIAAVQVDGKLVVYYYDKTNTGWKQAYFDKGWSRLNLDGGPNALSGSTAKVGGQLSVSVFDTSRLQVFYKAPDGGLQHTWTR